MEEVRPHPSILLTVMPDGIVYTEYEAGMRLRAEHAAPTIAAIEELFGRYRTLSFVVDARGLDTADAEYRRLFGRYLHERRARVRIAIYGASSPVRVLATLFAMATGVPMYAAREKSDALAWVRAQEAMA